MRSFAASSCRAARFSCVSSTTSAGALSANFGFDRRFSSPPISFSSLPSVFSSRAFSSATSMMSASGRPNSPPSTATVIAPLGISGTPVSESIRASRLISVSLRVQADCPASSSSTCSIGT